MKYINKKLVFGAVLFASVFSTQAMAHCVKTPHHAGASYPGKGLIPSHNNLAKPTGKSTYVEGQLVYLSGIVYDERCVPLKNAAVEIWQADAMGRSYIPGKGALINPLPIFAGAGRAHTDELGRYQFITVFPGAKQGRAPHVNMRITSAYTPAYQSTIFFDGDDRNEKDSVYKSLHSKGNVTAEVSPRNEVDSGYGEINARFDVTVMGRDPFRRF